MAIITIIGLVAATCTTISFLPQALIIIKTKNTAGLSLGMYSILTFGVFLWFVYGLLVNDWPLIIANAISLVFTGTILFLKMKYK